MQHIHINLKRFDVPATLGGVNRIAPINQWAQTLVNSIQPTLSHYPNLQTTLYLPEAHLLPALQAIKTPSIPRIGCQGISPQNITPGGNFGALTTQRPAAAMRALGCQSVIIGHSEERAAMAHLLQTADPTTPDAPRHISAIHRSLRASIHAALQSDLHVLYCIGESLPQRPHWQQILAIQLDECLSDLPTDHIQIAYEPIWAIGPGKPVPDRDAIEAAVLFIKSHTGGNLPVVYGGGLKAENARMLASIPALDGGLIALTRFTGEIGFYPDELSAILQAYQPNQP